MITKQAARWPKLSCADPRSAVLVRKVQIIHDSIGIVQGTRNRETAKSRLALINKLFSEIEQCRLHMTSPETSQKIAYAVASIRAFATDY